MTLIYDTRAQNVISVIALLQCLHNHCISNGLYIHVLACVFEDVVNRRLAVCLVFLVRLFVTHDSAADIVCVHHCLLEPGSTIVEPLFGTLHASFNAEQMHIKETL